MEKLVIIFSSRGTSFACVILMPATVLLRLANLAGIYPVLDKKASHLDVWGVFGAEEAVDITAHGGLVVLSHDFCSTVHPVLGI